MISHRVPLLNQRWRVTQQDQRLLLHYAALDDSSCRCWFYTFSVSLTRLFNKITTQNGLTSFSLQSRFGNNSAEAFSLAEWHKILFLQIGVCKACVSHWGFKTITWKSEKSLDVISVSDFLLCPPPQPLSLSQMSALSRLYAFTRIDFTFIYCLFRLGLLI